MNLLQKIQLAIRFTGLPNVLRAVRYAWRRDRLERRFAPPKIKGDWQGPGRLQEAVPAPAGADVRFQWARLELRFLAPDLLRVTWHPGQLPADYALAPNEWPEVSPTLRRDGDGWCLDSQELSVALSAEGGLSFFSAAGELLHRAEPPQWRGPAWRQEAPLDEQERIYGLGERAAGLNLRPGEYAMWNRDPGGSYTPGIDPLYICLPLYLGLHPGGSYLLFYENSHAGHFRFAERAEVHFEAGCPRYYLIPGPPARALERYADLTGRPPLPPRWALGYHQCRWGYRSSEDVREVLAGFAEHDLPISAVHLDIDYMNGYRVFTVDRSRFTDLAGMARNLEEQGVRLVAILDPGVKAGPDYAVFREGGASHSFCTTPEGKVLLAPVWPGWSAFPDFGQERVRTWWGRHYAQFLEQGLSGFWHDMNEPAAFVAWGAPTLPRCLRHTLEDRETDHGEAHNLYGLLMNRAGYEAQRRYRPGRRPFTLSRSGWAGLQRYAWTWTGDTASTWANLRQTVPTVLGLSLSGLPYSGPDIGGFSGDPSAELYTRWFQLAALLPFFRAHSALGASRREPWAFGRPTLDAARTMLKLRYRLLPYLYTLAWQAGQSGAPLVRPLFWPAGDDPDLWDVDDAFFLGDALLAAPVLEEGARSRSLTLPAGRWYDFWDDESREGPAVIELPAPLERIPLLVRAGSVLPQEEAGCLELHLYPPASGDGGGGALYSDAGDGYGAGRLDIFSLAWVKDGLLELACQERALAGYRGALLERPYAFPYRRLGVHLHGLQIGRAWVDGKEVAVEDGVLQAAPFNKLRLEVRFVAQ
ncbi:MAG: alpha-glucosidase [Chloroflexia bacterium]|nr:alpha-glucosidase [Chloroflexia bacterium]